MKFNRVQFLRTLLWIGVYLLIITLLISTVMRMNKLSEFWSTGLWPVESSIDYKYARYPIMTMVHILPGAVFILAGIFQFNKRFRNRHLTFHKWLGRVYLLLGGIVGITALVMGFSFAFGGAVESAGVSVFSLFFLYTLYYAYHYAKMRDFVRHREWMIRSYALGLAVATMRPIIGLFFALTDILFQDFFGYVFWLAFIPHILVAEWWIWYTRREKRKMFVKRAI